MLIAFVKSMHENHSHTKNLGLHCEIISSHSKPKTKFQKNHSIDSDIYHDAVYADDTCNQPS